MFPSLKFSFPILRRFKHQRHVFWVFAGLDDSAAQLQNLNATGTSLWADKEKTGNEMKTWNLEVFIKVLHELHPNLHWKEIIYELDHPGFIVRDRPGLILLIKALKLGFQVQGFQTPFPVDMFYRTWKHSEGQVSLIQEILKHSDVFNFAEHRHHAVAVEVLKVQPELVCFVCSYSINQIKLPK